VRPHLALRDMMCRRGISVAYEEEVDARPSSAEGDAHDQKAT
jgi:hypothetical protein